ncbi:myocardin-related transcription factor A-like [Anableps anableps]
MLEHLQGICINPAPFSPQPISSNMDEKAIRFALERRACLSLRKVLQLKLQQRRTREALVSCGVMPPLKSSAAFHEQRRGLERAQTEHSHKRKIRSETGSPEAITMHILGKKSAKLQLQAKQLQQKKVHFADGLNNKIAHRPGPIELINKNILPVDSCFKLAIMERRFPKASGGNSSCDEDSNDSLSPRQSESREHPVGIKPVCSSAEKLAGSNFPSPNKVPSSALAFQLSATPLNSCVQKTCGNSQIGCQHPTQKHKKIKDNKPKIKKLKYHQYIPPDKKGDTDPLPNLDSSYAKILQRQQLFLQLQILNQQQHNYHAPLPAPPNRNQDPPSSSSSSNLRSTFSPLEPCSAPPTVLSVQSINICPNSAPLGGTKVSSLHPNLDKMKVAELKCELKVRRLPVSGTRKDLIERLRAYQELSQGGDTISPPTAGGTIEPELKRRGASSKMGGSFSAIETSPQQLLRCDGAIKPFTRPSMLNGANPEEISFNSDPLGKLMSSPISDLSLQPFTTAPATATPKQEPQCSAPCRFSLKSASSLKHSLVSSAASANTAATPPVTIDKDRMLQEKDKQIAELTRMLWQNHRLVEELKMRLENGNRDASEAQILRRVKEEPPDRLHEAFSTSPPLLYPQISVISREKAVTKVTIKEEAIEEEAEAKMLVQSTNTLLQSSNPTQQGQDHIHLQLQPEKRSFQKQVCLQDSARQLVQQQAINRVLLIQQQNIKMQQHTVQSQVQETHQKCHPQRRKKYQKLHQQTQLLKSEQHHPQLEKTRLKQQLRKQESVVKKHHEQNKKLQPIQIQTGIHVQQQPRDNEDFIDIILQAGETPNTLEITQDFSFSSPSPSPFQLLLSPPDSPSGGTLQPGSPLQPEPWTPAKTTHYKQHFDLCGSGRLEDYLESTTGKPLQGMEPGSLLTLFDDLNNQMMSTTSILDIPPAPLHSLDTARDREQKLDSKDWLGFTMRGESEWETPTLVPQTPPSVFSADFLDSSDLHMDWDS